MIRRIALSLFVFILLGCGGSLSEEKRQALKKEMEDRAIKKISEEQIFEKALETGLAIRQELDNDSSQVVPIAQKDQVQIVWIDKSVNVSGIEKDIWEAYTYPGNSASMLTDNIQKKRDSLIYSSPVIRKDSLRGVWVVKMSRKKIVLSL